MIVGFIEKPHGGGKSSQAPNTNLLSLSGTGVSNGTVLFDSTVANEHNCKYFQVSIPATTKAYYQAWNLWFIPSY